MSTNKSESATGLSNASGDNVSKAIIQIANIVVETVRESGEFGAPSGIVFAALNQFGVNLDTYQQFISVLVQSGRLRREGDLLFATQIGGLQ